MEDATTGTSDLFVMAPQPIAAGEEKTDLLRLGCEGLQHFASRSPAPVVVLLAKGQVAEWRQAYAEAGADALLGLPVHLNTLPEALQRCPPRKWRTPAKRNAWDKGGWRSGLM